MCGQPVQDFHRGTAWERTGATEYIVYANGKGQLLIQPVLNRAAGDVGYSKAGALMHLGNTPLHQTVGMVR